ncbi:amidohydrolase family protein [Pseudoteredinibacter isoporae]|uniref:N-acyl-D-amino-acid deacylase n=1 Tax=Pseudoteredinibacter isoporae TaxID=570281 RepID=A0A7X0JSM0_9GAMM|nr:amidohydrolase family protein [Pseudoteredinibacter isoporae]MBB6521114.1 N-acyl-D-amino-acid deacylase [Pseudoteredinibacter isoporae]NHO86677.1 amidohydrolase family protein [Pseudoteredinibacter isoporae]NIB24871.1 amidohydrolase family protein [Pseudoteredinibacter isoporae]
MIDQGKIIDISQEFIAGAGQHIDCTGKYIAPGFIDAHSHMDYYAATENPEFFDSFTRQGITSFIGGNCGFSPCAAKKDGPHKPLLDNTLFEVPSDKSVVMDDLHCFDQTLAQSDIEHGFYSMVGHGSYRTSISGYEARDLNESEEELLFQKLEEALGKGAIGISLGLQYKPGVFVSRDEIIKVAKLCKKHGKVMAVHARAFSKLSGTYPLKPFGRAHNLLAIEDMISVAEETGVRLQFSHLIFVGKQTWQTAAEALDLIQNARERGVDICFDIFPYDCGATLLNTMFPDWFMASMPAAATSMLARLRLRAELEVGFRLVGFSYGDIVVSYAACEEYDGMEGKSISDIAKLKQQSKFNTLLDILGKSNSQARVLNNAYYGPGHIETLMKNPAVLFSTDAWPELHGLQNPAAFGSFPRFLQLSREQKNISLENCIRKMTGATADRFGISGVGYLKEGYQADVVVFDQSAVSDNTSAEDHSAAPVGIEQVYIKGKRMSL